jgi:hypothetical protein
MDNIEKIISIDDYFKKLRRKNSTSMGMGEIRLSLGRQEEICELFEEQRLGNILFPSEEDIKYAANDYVNKNSENETNLNSFISGSNWVIQEIIKTQKKQN